jgi:predicted ATP-dependent endonuclease of OLD family
MQIINFGPIENADIQLTNCSFFAGKNNVGKSVTAQLLYGIMKVFSPTLEEVSCHLPELVESEFVSMMEEVVRKNKKTKSSPRKSSKKSKGKSKARSRKPTRAISGVWKVSQKDLEQMEEMAHKRRNMIKKHINSELSSFCQGALKDKIESEIKFVFSSSIYDYIRLGEENAKIHFDYEDSLYQCVFSLGIYRKSQSIRLETNIKVDDAFLNKYLKDMFRFPIKHLKGKNIRYTWETSGKLNVNFAAPTSSLRDSNPPSISGVVADYYSLLMSFEGKKGHYNKMVREISAKTLGGLLEMDSDEFPFSVMKYRLRTPDGDEAAIDITKASSMVKELAPILMVVAEKLRPHDVLIIEEPESHLQSKTQLDLAEFFFNLSKEGVRILMTTHSELMLRQCFQLFDQKDLPISGNLFIFKTTS